MTVEMVIKRLYLQVRKNVEIVRFVLKSCTFRFRDYSCGFSTIKEIQKNIAIKNFINEEACNSSELHAFACFYL